MRILFDHQAFSIQTRGGISRYFVELMHHLEQIKGTEVISILGYSENIHLLAKTNTQRSFISRQLSLINSSFKDKVLKNLLLHFNKIYSIRALRKMNYDIFIPTYFDTYFIPYLGNTPFVLTVYDMIHELMPDQFILNDSTVSRKKLLIEKSTKIIAISQSTKSDILRIYPHIPPHKIEVIHLAHQKLDVNENCSLLLPDQFILFVGKRSAYKNFDLFFKGIKHILVDNLTLHLVCVGGGPFSSYELEMFTSAGLKKRISQLNVDDITLTHLYRQAKVFAFPSLYEGFGIPVLEAMSEGCPVLLGHLSSFPEVAGDAGYYCDVSNQDSIAEAMNTLLNDDKLLNELSEKGKMQASKFTWSKNALEWNKVLCEVSKTHLQTSN